MPFGIDPSQISDAEVVDGTSPPPPVAKHVANPNVINISQAYQNQGLAQPAADQLAMAETRARAIGLFVQIPVLTIIALHPKVPGVLRLVAGGLAAWNAYQIATQEKQIEQMLPDGWA